MVNLGKKPAVHPRTVFFLAGVVFGDCIARRRGSGGVQEQLCTDGMRWTVRQRSCQRGCGYFLRPRLQETEKNFSAPP